MNEIYSVHYTHHRSPLGADKVRAARDPIEVTLRNSQRNGRRTGIKSFSVPSTNPLYLVLPHLPPSPSLLLLQAASHAVQLHVLWGSPLTR